MKVATGLVTGPSAKPELAAQAVQAAMAKADIQTPSSVLLFLTSEFAADPQSAIKAAAVAARCTQIIGCSASGIFTEDDWVIDGAAAAAMVFSEGVHLSSHSTTEQAADLLLTLAAPNAINATWLRSATPMFGGVSGDATGQGPFSVWYNGKGSTQGLCQIKLHQTRGVVAASHGVELISPPRKISKSQGYDLHTIGNTPALRSLESACGKINRQYASLGFHQVMAVYSDKSSNIERGDYHLCNIIAGNDDTHTVTLAQQLAEETWLSWALRDTDAAQVDIVKTANQLKQKLGQTPEFGLMFSCMGRGPYFYEGNDQDLALIKALFPKLPLIGFYGNGEIAPLQGSNQLLQYSAVLGFFAHEPV